MDLEIIAFILVSFVFVVLSTLFGLKKLLTYRREGHAIEGERVKLLDKSVNKVTEDTTTVTGSKFYPVQSTSLKWWEQWIDDEAKRNAAIAPSSLVV